MSTVDGVLLLDKPSGPSSNGVLQTAKRLLGALKGGHTGTLDPLATGLLPLCFGEATKFSAIGLEADKVYEATVAFGLTTTTGDAEGEIVQRREPLGLHVKLPNIVQGLVGSMQQAPPMFSAARHDGKRLYEYARAGRIVERSPRSIAVHEIKILELGSDFARLELHVSKGTYVRVLAEDLGEKVGCGAHLTALRRTRVGEFRLQEAITLATLAEYPQEARPGLLKPVDFLLGGFPVCELADAEARAIRQGRGLTGAGACDWSGLVRVYHRGRFIGLAERREGGKLAARRLVSETT